MAQPPARPSKGRVIFRAVVLFIVVFGGILGATAVFHPDTPLPDGWNPIKPLKVAEPVTPLTGWKLRRAADDRTSCLAALDDVAKVTPLQISETRNPNCEVRVSVRVDGVGAARIDLTETACATALRLAMWERHGVQPAARRHLNTDVTGIVDSGSYNCRRMRTSTGNSNRWSTHATAMAVDVSGFDLADGRQLRLLRDWNGDADAAAFLRDVRDSSCTWFATTLSPDYNALHADHFHLQSTGWGTCR